MHDPAPWSISPRDRAGHLLVVGADSAAKRGLMLNALEQDIAAGAGVAVIDVTGRFANSVLDTVPPERHNQTWLFQPHRQKAVIGFNPFSGVPEAGRSRAAQDIMELFKVIWDLDYDRTPLLLDLLRSAARVLLDSEEGTLLSLYGLFTNAGERQRLVAQCHDPLTRKFWRDFESWSPQDQRDRPQPVLTRLRAFLSDPCLRNTLGQVRGKLSLEHVVAKSQVFLADVSRHALGAETARLFACLFATRVQSIVEGRGGGAPFYLYLPDAQQIHVAIAARALATQTPGGGIVASLDQIAGLTPAERSGVLAAEQVLALRLGPDDARLLAGRFPLPQSEAALTTLGHDQLAISDRSYEWRALPSAVQTYRGRRHIARRSENALGVPRRRIEAKLTRYIDGL